MKAKLKLPSRDFVLRVTLAVAVAAASHLLQWRWLRFATSEIIFRFASHFGFETARTSFDTVWINGTFFQFAISCTFIDVILGAIPLVWNDEKGWRTNLLRVCVMAAALFSFNILRLAVSQLLYANGLSWTVADGVLGSLSYFVVWLVITNRYWSGEEQDVKTQIQTAPEFR